MLCTIRRKLIWVWRAGAMLALSAAGCAGAWAQEISWNIPEEGGTPRDASRIERTGPAEFRIRASFEDGTASILRHAVSRVDLVCRNAGARPATVTVHFDLSDDGKRTDYDSKPESGMKLRDFLFIQPPNGTWRQVNGTTKGWVATVQFEAQAGETRVGLSPWYTYSDLLRFLNGLPAHPRLTKRVAGKSDGGREQWELTITDAEIPPDKKRTIFWQAREHAYETWSSFAMEGLVEFLLTDAAGDFCKHYNIVLHPMTNVDGVAQGFEYRGSYDLPGPRLKASGRVTLEAIDRLRPGFAVAWHNWIAPRDRNVVFYTDGDNNNQPTARAWLRFTQLFPSLRGADHRWKDESRPLKYNWQNRTPLSDDNVHQYAMKKYGTRVWGWEMPWWNLTVPEVRASGAAFAKAFLTTLNEIQAGTVTAAVEEPDISVDQWGVHEFTLHARTVAANPWRDAALVGEFTSPTGRTKVVDGFYDGGDTWRLRFTPDEAGVWTWLLRGEGVEILRKGKLRCVSNGGHGFIRIHPKDPYSFHRSTSAYIPMGDTCYGLFDDTPITPELRAAYLHTRQQQGFNFVRMTVGHSEARAKADPAWWAWGGTFDKPDLDRFNPAFFQKFDDLIRELDRSSMDVELILLNFYRRPFTDTALWTPERERQWLRYLIARYGAFTNIFLWTLANEYETHPDGKYRLDFPADVEWAKTTANWIKATDPWQHLTTVHPVIFASRKGESPRAPFDPPWRIGEYFGDCPGIDVLSQQTGQSGEGTQWDEKLQCWTGDSATVAASIAADRKYRKPVLNSESGYEYLRGDPTSKKQVHHTDKVRRTVWRIHFAGGFFAAGFHGTIGHSDAWNRIDPGGNYTFKLKDEGAGKQLHTLHNFMASQPLQDPPQPFAGITGNPEASAIALPGTNYAVYLPRGGPVKLDLTAATKPLTGQWLNPRTGEYGERFEVTGGKVVEFTAADEQDWVLDVRVPAPK